MGLSKTIYSIPLDQLIKHEIIEDDLSRDDENVRHCFVKDEGKGL